MEECNNAQYSVLAKDQVGLALNPSLPFMQHGKPFHCFNHHVLIYKLFLTKQGIYEDVMGRCLESSNHSCHVF